MKIAVFDAAGKKRFYFVTAILVVGTTFTILFQKNKAKGQVLSKKIEQSEPTSISSPTPMPTETPTPNPTLTPTPTPIPVPTVSSQQINGFIERFAGQYGVDPNVLRHLAICESGFRSNAINGPYLGLFQFNKNAWKKARQQMGENTNPNLRLNAEEAIQTAAYLISKGRKSLWPNCFP